MDLGHDLEGALATVVDIVNSAPERSALDGLTDLAALESLVAGRPPVLSVLTREDLTAVRQLRGRLQAVVDAQDEAAAVRLVNALVADGGTTPRLTDHDGWPLHVHYDAPGMRIAEHLAAGCGMALAFLIAAGERQRLATCAAPGCERVLVDLSRNRSKRYCDRRTCGNRMHVAAYRARRRAHAPPPADRPAPPPSNRPRMGVR